MNDPVRHPSDDTLQEWLDRDLPADQAARVGDHVADCAACRAAASRLRALLASLRALPRGMNPPDAVLEGARRRIAGIEDVPIGIDRHPRRRGLRRAGMVAAAVALLLIGAAAGLLLGPEREPTAFGPGGSEVGLVTADYDRAVADLGAALDARRDELDPATVRIVEENLRVVDRAIGEARRALAADPTNSVLRELVVASYEQKLDLLRRATRPAAEL